MNPGCSEEKRSCVRARACVCASSYPITLMLIVFSGFNDHLFFYSNDFEELSIFV